MNKTTAMGIGLLVAATVPAFVSALSTPLVGGGINLDPLSIAGLTVAFYPFSLAAGMVLGMPLFFVFRHYDLVRWWSAVLSGLAAGAAAAIVLRLPGRIHAQDFFALVPLGGIAGLTFWVVWRQGD